MRSMITLLALLVAARFGFAQEAPPTVASILERPARTHSLVRLAAEQARVMGRLAAVENGKATLLMDYRQTRTIELSRIDTVWVRGTGARTGALIGSGVGAVGFGTFLALLFPAFCETACDGIGLMVAVVCGVIGESGGELDVELIGELYPAWHRRYP
jgi:hypothetical protein